MPSTSITTVYQPMGKKLYLGFCNTSRHLLDITARNEFTGPSPTLSEAGAWAQGLGLPFMACTYT